jgi:hypothetical protein
MELTPPPPPIIAVFDQGPPSMLIYNKDLDKTTRTLIEMIVTENPPQQAVSVFMVTNKQNSTGDDK